MGLLQMYLGDDYKPSISRLKSLRGRFYNPMSFFEKEMRDEEDKPDSPSMIRGKLVEDWLQGVTDTEDKYIVIPEDIVKPNSEKAGNMLLHLSLTLGIPFDDITDEAFIKAAELEGYGNGKYSAKVVKDKLTPYKDYYQLLCEKEKSDKPTISSEVINQAKKMYTGATLDPLIMEFLNNPDGMWQVELEIDYEGVVGKGYADYILKQDNTIYLIDIKTTELNVLQAARLFRWDMQLAYYAQGLKPYMDKDTKIVLANLVFTPFYEKPIYIEYTERDYEIALNGNESVEGVKSLLSKYKHHLNTDDWEHPYHPTDDNFLTPYEFSIKSKLNLWTF